MAITNADIDALATLTRSQLDALARDFVNQPVAVREKARALRSEIVNAELRAAINDFDAASKVFIELTNKLVDITEEARKNPTGDAVGMLTPVIRRFAGVLTEVAETPTERAVPAGPADAEVPAAEPDHQPAAAAAPPPGTARNSRKYAEIADEYVATFDAATVDPAKLTTIDRMCRTLTGFRDRYEGIGRPLSIPWHFVGLIHALESSFNFACHLHNGDSLAHRTRNEPAGRPPASVADPPFAWSTSAIDALQHHDLGTVGNWTLSRQLFELERYNGFGYRFRGLASPYLWSFSDRYLRGKFVADHVFDPDKVSAQAGAAVLLKRLIENGTVQRPAN